MYYKIASLLHRKNNNPATRCRGKLETEILIAFNLCKKKENNNDNDDNGFRILFGVIGDLKRLPTYPGATSALSTTTPAAVPPPTISPSSGSNALPTPTPSLSTSFFAPPTAVQTPPTAAPTPPSATPQQAITPQTPSTQQTLNTPPPGTQQTQNTPQMPGTPQGSVTPQTQNTPQTPSIRQTPTPAVNTNFMNIWATNKPNRCWSSWVPARKLLKKP